MAYFALLWKARTIEKYRLKYEKEKINSIVAANAELPKHTFYQKLKLYRYDSQKKLSRIFRRLCPEGSKVSNFFVYLKTDQTFSNFLVKSVIGFVGGIVLTYFWFMFFVFQLSISLIHATIMSSIIGVLLTLGLAFSYRIRCLVFLLIPQFFSRVGRYTLTCYALVLILTGPATNTLKNSEVLSESLACGQEQVKWNVNKLSESMKKPLYLMRDTIGTTVKKLKSLAGKVKEMMVDIHRLTMSLAHVLQSSLSWLNSVESICNAKIGSPYEHCIQVLSHDLARSKGRSNLDYLVQAICFNLKTVDAMCVVGDFAKGSIVATVRKKLETFSARISSMMFVAVHVKRSHSCYSNASRSASQVAAGIVTEIRTRADPLLTWLSWSSCLTSLFLLLIIFRAKYYQQMFETRSRFDNRYVTKELRDLDLRRLRQGRETVLPLNTRERAKYVSTTSFRLLSSEKVHLTRSIVFMIITTFKLLIHMVADYSLYWVLMNIRFHGRFQTVLQPGDATAGVKVAGSGPLPGIVRGLIDALSVPLAVPSPSPISCLPNPHPPDFQRYAQIGILILLLWLCALCEPYGLRLRHVIMGHYQPERARARASWLYNHIIRTRGCFLKYARRKLHRDFKHATEEKQTFKRWLTDIIPCRCLRYLLGLGPKDPHCLLCGTKQLQNDPDTYLKRCETPTCPGIYCARCFLDIGQLCTICLSPKDYGDLSDVSLEKWSSEDSDDDDSDNDRRGAKEPLLKMTDNYSGDKRHDSLSNNNNTKRTSRSEIFPKSKDEGSNEETSNFLNNDNFKSNNERNGDTFKTQGGSKNQLESNIDLEQSVKESNARVVVRGADRLLKSVEAPKEKLSGIMNTMRLLTKKMDAGEIHKEWKKHDSKKFEYLVMELFQPMDIFKKALFVRHAKHANGGKQIKFDDKDESFEEVIPFLSTYEMDNKIETNVDNASIDANVHDSKSCENLVDIEKKTELLHSTKSKSSVHKRDIKGIKQNYIKLKQSISADVMKLRKRRIYFSKIQFVSKRRRRNHPKKCIVLQTMRVGKALNESVESEIKQLRAKLEIELKKMDSEINGPKKTKLILDKKTFNDNIRKFSSNIISDVSSDINASDMKDEPSTPEENNGNKNKDAGQANTLTTIVHKTQDNHSKCVLHGLCSRLWHLARSVTSRKPFSSSKQDEPSTDDIANHKRRKKPLTRQQKQAYKTNLLNNDARNYRISLYLKEQEWLKQSDSDPPEHLNHVLTKLKRKAEKRKIKEAEILKKEVQKNLLRELKLKAKAELKLKKEMKKQLIAEEKKKHQKQKKLLDTQTTQQTPKIKESKKDKKQKALSKIKEEVSLEKSSTSFAEKLLNNVVKEMSTSDQVRLGTPKICLSNNLNFYGFNNPILDLPEENLNLDEIFGEEKETIEKDTVSEKDSKVNNAYYQDVAEKHQYQPNYWPYDRYGGTQTGIEEEKVEKPLEAKAENEKSKKKRSKVENTTKKITAKSIKSAVSEVYVEMKKPVTKMKNFCSCIKDRTASKTVSHRISPSGEKAIHVVPITISRSCQDLSFPAIFNKYTQSHVTKVKHCPTQCESDKCFCGEHDVGVAALQETCTCAAQCTLRCQGETVRKVNVGTMHNNAYKRTTNVAIQYEHYRRCVNQGLCELCENPKFPLPKLKRCQCHPCSEPKECGGEHYIPDAEDDRWSIPCWNEERECTKPRHKRTRNILCQCDPCGDGGSGSGSCTSIFCESDTDCTGNTVTDTICTHVAIDYNSDKHKRKRVKVVKKNNQSTTTDRQALVDVSTITGDWWSPLLERKKNITLEKKTGDYSINQKEKTMETKSGRKVSPKRFAQIKSHQQHKIRVNDGILSPSKYILECQENDYELFPSIPPIVAMTCVKKLNEERSNYGYGAHRHTRKGHKSKRLEESYSPRKKTETSSVSLSPAKWRPVDRNEEVPHALRHYRRRNDKLQSNQKSRAMQKSRDKASRASKNAKRLQVTRSFTDNEKEGDSVAGHCNSTSSLAIT